MIIGSNYLILKRFKLEQSLRKCLMLNSNSESLPIAYSEINRATQSNGFTMPSDVFACSLLRTLAAAKPAGKFLELGTGTGLSTSWILDGMDNHSAITSLDNDEVLLKIAKTFLGQDERLNLVHSDGEEWIKANLGQKFDYIFADTWHGKYLLLDEVLEMMTKGGSYIADDMLPQPHWPEGHQEKATNFIKYLTSRRDLFITELHWSTGIIIAVKK